MKFSPILSKTMKMLYMKLFIFSKQAFNESLDFWNRS